MKPYPFAEEEKFGKLVCYERLGDITLRYIAILLKGKVIHAQDFNYGKKRGGNLT